MKASDFFQDVDVHLVEKTSEVMEREKVNSIYDEGLELENWISKQLRLEREKIENTGTDEVLNDSIDSISDYSQETLKEMFHQDQELQVVDQNEDQCVAKTFYVNPDIKWTLQKWPNLAERLVAQSESPKVEDSECSIIGEAIVQDPRLRKKYGFDASGLKMSFQQCVAMKKVEKNTNEEEHFFIPRSTKVLMLPYLWPLVKYVKKDLMKFFNDVPEKRGPVTIESDLGREKVSRTSSNLEIIELDDQEDPVSVTVSLLYDDLVITPPQDFDTYNSKNFSTKRTWDEMKNFDLSLERSRILDELTTELNKSTSSNSSTFEDPSTDLVISFEEQDSSTKRIKLDKCSSEENASWIIVKDLIQERVQGIFTEQGSETQLGALKINSLEIEDDLEIIENEAAEGTEKNLEYKCSDLSKEMDESFETGSDDCVVSDKSSSKLPKSVRLSRTGLVQRRSFTRGTMRRYLGSKRCFGRSLC